MPLDLASSARRLAETLSVERVARSYELPIWLRHFIALVMVVAALLIRLFMDPWVGADAVPYVVFNAAIAISAFLWGRSPGITATVASALLCDYFITIPRQEFNFFYSAGGLAPMLFFIATGLTVSILAGHLYSTRFIAHQRHKLLAVTLSSIGDAVIVADALGNVSFVNHIAEQLTGWSAAEARGRKLSAVFRIIDETSRQPIDSPVENALRTGEVVTLANHTLLVTKNGREIPIDDSGAPIRQDDGSIQGVILVFRDFTERRRREQDIQRLNRLLKARSTSSRALLHASDETQYLQEVCRLVVEDCGYAMVWIGYARDDDAKSIVPMAYAGMDEGYLQTLNLTWADCERGRGPTGTAIRTGKLDRCHDMLSDPRFAPWRAQALLRGFASSIALPILHDGKAFASLTIYSSLPNPFTPDEIRLLEELADDLAHGIESIRLRAAHDQARELLRASEERLRFALEGMHAGAWEFDLATRVAQRSLLYDQIFGYDVSPPQWSFEMFIGHVIPEDRTWVQRKIQDAIAAGCGWNFECRILRSDGAQRWIWICAQLFGNVAGKPTRAVGIVLDITARCRAEEALVEANAQLEERVSARTQQLAAANVDLRAQMDAYRRLEAEVARLVEDERLHLGMELHDDLCQQLAAVTMLTASLSNKLRDQDHPLADTAARVLTSLRHAGDDAHILARGLLPVQVEADGLMVALEALARRTQEMNAVQCAFDCAAPVPLASNAAATHLFRIVQEAIQNAIKHGNARHIVISLQNCGQIELSIQDDGEGVDHKIRDAAGSGLRIMAYRARVIGGTLSVNPVTPRGTIVRCTLPVPANNS